MADLLQEKTSNESDLFESGVISEDGIPEIESRKALEKRNCYLEIRKLGRTGPLELSEIGNLQEV